MKTYPPAFPIYPIDTLRDLLVNALHRYPDWVAMRSKKDHVYRSLTFRQLEARVRELATAFFEIDLKKGDRVAVLSNNCTEWAVTYLAAVASGKVIVPIDKDLKAREIIHILQYAEVKVLVCSEEYVGQLHENRGQLPALEKIVSMETERGEADLTLEELHRTGSTALAGGDHNYEKVSVSPDDLAAIIFTSGTMGSSKAVMLTHKNIASNVMGTSHNVAINQDDVLLSVLPLHHTYECTAGFLTALYQGATICHAENLRRIPENMQETHTTVMLGVPLLFEAFYKRIEAGIKEKGERKFRVAKRIASFAERFLRINLRKKIFGQLHQRFGGHLRLFISGGAAINPAVAKGFRELGIDLIQGYGMTEAAPIIAVNRVENPKDASVGLPVPGVEVRIEDDEIVVRGPGIMKGYYLNEVATQETLQEGWLYTGDLGYLDDDGFLYITGRKKSVIVTPNGKNVYPEEIERLLNESPYILESLVWGGPEQEPSRTEVQAVIVPQTEAFDHEFGASRYDEVKVNEVISREVNRVNADLANYKRLRKFTLRAEEFEKTTTRKIKRYLYTGKPKELVSQ